MTLTKALFCIGVSLFLCSGTMVLAQGPPGGTPGGPPIPATATVLVDCDLGESINDALGTLAVELTIEIIGVCEENVIVDRDNVILRGLTFDIDGNPLDGINAASTDDELPFWGNTVTIRGAVNVTLEDLTITGGVVGLLILDSGTLFVNSNTVSVSNCLLKDNSFLGLRSVRSSGAEIVDTAFTGNGSGGINAILSSLRCRGCDIEGVVSSINHSAVVLENSMLHDSLRAALQSAIRLTGISTQDGNTSGNSIDTDSQLVLFGASSLQGPTTFNGFSTGLLRGVSTHNGNMFCLQGSEVFCSNPAGQVTGFSDCSQCPAP